MRTDYGYGDDLNEWFENVEGRTCSRDDLLELDTLLVEMEVSRPLNKAQKRAVQAVLATVDDAIDHGIAGMHLSDTINGHLAAAGHV